MDAIGTIELTGSLLSRVALMGAVARTQALIERLAAPRFLAAGALAP